MTLDKLRDKLLAMPLRHSCVMCEYYQEGFCKHWQDHIPPEHLDAGCDDWREDLIPF
ncbi:MAG: hypothetical protein ACR2RB_02265 [Gammaproteobacteria bacterium]